MGGPPSSEPSSPGLRRPNLFIVEAGDARDRTCADCGKKTSQWKPSRRRGTAVILCLDCATKTEAGGVVEGACPSCGEALRPGDRFCGKCGLRFEYACPACGTGMEPEDLFCAKCGTRVA